MKGKTNWTRRKIIGAIPASLATVMLGVNAGHAGAPKKEPGVRFGVRMPFQEPDLRQ
ncbi:MAG: hypothetical protein L0Z53_21415 [Acidobacteriales bacterium]|nr:hypothetical protein [Terriglobales bacterium]